MGYKCASVSGGMVCYAVKDVAADTLFKTLQTTINRFATTLSFPPIKVDGIVGKGTTTAAILALNFVFDSNKTTIGSNAGVLATDIDSPDDLARQAQVVNDVLTKALQAPATAQAAAAAGAPAPSPPAPMPPAQAEPTPTQIATTPANTPVQSGNPQVEAAKKKIQEKKPGLKPSLLDRVPPWATYAGGALLALGAIGLVMRFRPRASVARAAPAPAPAPAPAVSGRGWSSY